LAVREGSVVGLDAGSDVLSADAQAAQAEEWVKAGTAMLERYEASTVADWSAELEATSLRCLAWGPLLVQGQELNGQFSFKGKEALLALAGRSLVVVAIGCHSARILSVEGLAGKQASAVAWIEKGSK
jgi:hypothetical protein